MFYTGGEKRNQNRDSIKRGKRTAGKGDSAIQCYMHSFNSNCSFYDPSAFIWFSFWCVPKNSMSPSNGERGQSTASMADIFNNNERFHNKQSNA